MDTIYNHGIGSEKWNLAIKISTEDQIRRAKNECYGEWGKLLEEAQKNPNEQSKADAKDLHKKYKELSFIYQERTDDSEVNTNAFKGLLEELEALDKTSLKNKASPDFQKEVENLFNDAKQIAKEVNEELTQRKAKPGTKAETAGELNIAKPYQSPETNEKNKIW